MLQQGCLPGLVKFMHGSDEETSHQACAVIANMAEVQQNQGKMVQDGLLQHLKFVLRSNTIEVRAGAEELKMPLIQSTMQHAVL